VSPFLAAPAAPTRTWARPGRVGQLCSRLKVLIIEASLWQRHSARCRYV